MQKLIIAYAETDCSMLKLIIAGAKLIITHVDTFHQAGLEGQQSVVEGPGLLSSSSNSLLPAQTDYCFYKTEYYFYRNVIS